MLVISALAACEPAPPSSGDGHDLGLITNGVPTTLNAGRANDYPVQVANFGTTTATNAKFMVVAPLSLSLSGNVNGNDCDLYQNDTSDYIICDLGDLAPSATVTIDVEGWVGDWPTPRDVVYAASSDGAEANPDPHPNAVSVATAVTRPAFTVPSVTITSPSASATTSADATIAYAASADDEVDGDLSGQIHWSYVAAGDPDATPTALPTGASGSFGPIAEGIYVLIASVTNSSGVSAQATRTITVDPSTADGHDMGFITDRLGHVAWANAGLPSYGELLLHNYGTAIAHSVQVLITSPATFPVWAYYDTLGTECPFTVDATTNTKTSTCTFTNFATGNTRPIFLTFFGTPGAPPATVDFDMVTDTAEPNPDPHPNELPWTFTSQYNTPPSLTITAPGTGADVSSSSTISYGATAQTPDHRDLSDHIEWSYVDADDPEASPTQLPGGTSGTFGPLPAGTYTLTARVDDGSGQSTTATSTLTVHDVTAGDRDLGIVVSNVPSVVPVGSDSTFSVSVHNYGPNRANNVLVTLGSDGTLHATIDGANQPGEANQQATRCYNAYAANKCTVYALAPGATFSMTARITPDTAGTIALNATVTSDGTESSPDPHPGQVATPITVGIPDAGLPAIALSAPEPYNGGFLTTDDVSVPYFATATDAVGNDLSGAVAWSLTRLGVPGAPAQDLGAGASGSIDPLDAGIYLLTASVTDSSGRTASEQVVVTVLPAGMSCSIDVTFNPVSGLYLPQTMLVDATRSYDTCGRRMQFYWDVVYTAVSESDRLAFNAMMNNDAQDMTRGTFTLHQPDEWIMNLVVCAPATGSIAESCAVPVSRDWASADVVIG